MLNQNPLQALLHAPVRMLLNVCTNSDKKAQMLQTGAQPIVLICVFDSNKQTWPLSFRHRKHRHMRPRALATDIAAPLSAASFVVRTPVYGALEHLLAIRILRADTLSVLSLENAVSSEVSTRDSTSP
jgi:hypothetical protein